MANSMSFDSFSTSLAETREAGPRQLTQTPITTGTSVLAIKFNGGVVFAADTLGSFGALARFRDCPRLLKVNDTTVIGCTGDYADYQHLKAIIEQLAIDDVCKDDNITLTPRSLHSWLTRVLYNKRSKMDPLWTTIVVGGIENGEGFLGYVDKLGTAYKDPVIATGYGAYMATPLMRNAYREDLTEQQAVKVITDSMRTLYYRDARAWDKYQIAIVTAAGARVEGPLQIDSDWSIAHYVKGYE